ncbi:glycoside hydrolase family 15 protein [Rubrobacter taiwanensis]|jgi:GH15 family glucan-1,4-alpha-glucosidase|uniref:Glycoside hydrolase family 15 protein n=1 Tax=Rubrobacter taiwanensis TaxID=185139 RepID=A0A4V2NWC3_9ACTN|nr:glycoside hydrolase family 15 protein [Rubrobacter taiwanensis]TCJ16832.1 glycoside hydrolase family 15 protein [Rubrobacter taiwanensis]
MSAGEPRRRYPPISSYGFLSDTHTAALVGPDAAVEWFCVPRFDAPSIFARMLDRERGGAFELSVEGADRPAQRYLGDTLVLESRFEGRTGAAVAFDFLAVRRVAGDELAAGHILVRLVRCESGSVRVRAGIDARPGYGAEEIEWQRRDRNLWRAADPELWVSSDAPLELEGSRLSAEAELREGEAAAFALGYAGEPPRSVDADAAGSLLEQTCRAWQEWAGHCRYDGVAREAVVRSALVLRGLAFDETGALVAAPTTSLPEELGGERNWDYRFTWHRDASLLVLALFRLGYEEEGRRYMDFLLSQCTVRRDRLAPMAGIGGEPESEERTLDHLEGYASSRPVRTGNEAYEQVQLDTYGHVLDAAFVYRELTGDLAPEHWPVLQRLVDLVCERWREPDHGVWEIRVEKRQHTYSKMMAWVCLDRGIRLAEMLEDTEAPLERWRRAREEVYRDVLERGYDKERGAFTQVYGERPLDAAVLHAPLMGFLPGDDPRMISTIDRLIEELGAGEALLYRYDTTRVDDGVPGHEGAFLMCSFDLVSALVLAGRVEEARRRFEWLLEHASPLGLFSEELSPDGEALGNYPQAFTHLALIEAAMNLDAAGNREALHAWAAERSAESGASSTSQRSGRRAPR